MISKVGRPDDGTDPKIFNSSEEYVDFIPESQWRPGKNKDDLIREMDAAVSAIPGMEPSFSRMLDLDCNVSRVIYQDKVLANDIRDREGQLGW